VTELVGLGFVLIGAAVAVWALWKVSALAIDGPAEHAGPYIFPFVIGMAIAIVGGFVLVGQLLWRLIA
jgi:hypothetical protein